MDYTPETNRVRWWPFALFFGLVLTGLLFLFFTTNNQYRSPLEPTTGCVVMQDRGSYRDSINVVFLGTSYEDPGKFQQDTESMMNSFLSTQPFSSYKDRFNFFRIEEIKDYSCTYDDAVVCNPSVAQKEAIKCPGNDYVIVLTDRSNVQNFFRHLRSSSWSNIAALNVADDHLVFAHEFAHIFADFADEYEYGGKINWDAPNCDSEKLTCPKFSSVPTAECVLGCVNSENSRSISVGIMRDYWTSKRFGDYNEKYLENQIIEDSKEIQTTIRNSGVPKEKPIEVYVVSGICNESDCSITSVQKSPGYETSHKEESTLTLVQGEYSLGIPIKNRLIKEFRDSGEIIYPTSFEFTVAVPAVDEEPLTLVNNGIIDDIYFFNIQGSFSGVGQNVNILQVTQG